MSEQKLQELNKKLAEWAGFHKIEPNMSVDWWRPDGQHEGSDLPNFAESLDACFKWLVPKVIEVMIERSRKITPPLTISDTAAFRELILKWLSKNPLQFGLETTLLWAIREVKDGE